MQQQAHVVVVPQQAQVTVVAQALPRPSPLGPRTKLTALHALPSGANARRSQYSTTWKVVFVFSQIINLVPSRALPRACLARKTLTRQCHSVSSRSKTSRAMQAQPVFAHATVM